MGSHITKISGFLFKNISSKQIVIKNTLWLLIGEAINKGSVFLIMLFIAQRLGPEQFGAFSYIISFVALYTVIVDYGLANLIIREVSNHPKKSNTYLINSLVLKILLGVLNVGIVYGASVLLDNETVSFSLIIVYCLYTVINNIGEFVRVFFRTQEHMQHEAGLKIINGLLLSGIITYTLITGGDLPSIILAFFLSGLLNLFISGIYVFRYFDCFQRSNNFDRKILGLLINKGFIIALGILFVNIYINFDQFLLGWYGFTYDLGVYALGYKITFVYTIIFAMLFQTFLPRIVKNPNIILYHQGFKRISYINAILVVLYGGLSYFMYSQSYRDIGPYRTSLGIFLFLLVYCVFESYAHRGYIHLLALKKDKQILLMFLLCALFNIIGNLLAIPLYSYTGAIVINILTYLLYGIISYLFVHRGYQDKVTEKFCIT